MSIETRGLGAIQRFTTGSRSGSEARLPYEAAIDRILAFRNVGCIVGQQVMRQPMPSTPARLSVHLQANAASRTGHYAARLQDGGRSLHRSSPLVDRDGPCRAGLSGNSRRKECPEKERGTELPPQPRNLSFPGIQSTGCAGCFGQCGNGGIVRDDLTWTIESSLRVVHARLIQAGDNDRAGLRNDTLRTGQPYTARSASDEACRLSAFEERTPNSCRYSAN